MTRYRNRLLALGLAVVAGTGCSSATSRFYTLDSTATGEDGVPVRQVAVVVGPVTIPGTVDRPQFTVQVAPNRVELDEFNRWASPLDTAIARTVAGDLTTLLGSPRVATAPLANFDATYRVTIDVQRFDSVQGQAAVLDAVWVVRQVIGSKTRSGRTVVREEVSGTTFDALAAGHSRAVGRLSADVAVAIRALAADDKR